MTAETAAALERALVDQETCHPCNAGDRHLGAVEDAARAHLASERREAEAALERVRERILAARRGDPDGMSPPPPLGFLSGATMAVRFLDAELTRLREGTG